MQILGDQLKRFEVESGDIISPFPSLHRLNKFNRFDTGKWMGNYNGF